LDDDRIKLTGLIAGPAFHTFILIQEMGLFLLSRNRLNRADPDTSFASRAFFGIDRKRDEPVTELSRALFILDVCFVFILEISKGG
jgi:hypothetical protein